MKQTDHFYKSKRWKKQRAAILARDGYICQISKRYGKQVPANTVHHIFPRKEYPEYAFCSWNLISVCAKVHNALEDRATGELSEKGIELLCRTARARGMDPPPRIRKKTDARETGGRNSFQMRGIF